jgi:hypothetical protein
MSPLVKVELVGHNIDGAFGRALPALESFDPARLAESMAPCTPFAETINVVDIRPESPLDWRYPAAIGLHHLRGVPGNSQDYLGNLPDQGFALGILLATYLDVIQAAQPVVHKVVTIANNVFISYRKLSYPVYAASQQGRSRSGLCGIAAGPLQERTWSHHHAGAHRFRDSAHPLRQWTISTFPA